MCVYAWFLSQKIVAQDGFEAEDTLENVAYVKKKVRHINIQQFVHTHTPFPIISISTFRPARKNDSVFSVVAVPVIFFSYSLLHFAITIMMFREFK